MSGLDTTGRTLVAFPKSALAGSILPLGGNPRVNHGSRPARLLVVEDDPILQTMVVGYLEGQGMRVASASGRRQAVLQNVASEPDLILLGLRLDQNNGLDLLREIRSRSDIPVIITSSDGCTEIDRVVGLELGADDYIAKPFGLRELLARIRAILRRRENGCAMPRQDSEWSGYRFGGWQLDRRSRRLTAPDGKPVALTNGEYTLLTVFLDAPQRPLTRERLLQTTRVHEDIFDRSIDVQVLRLRRKLETDPSKPHVIRTERGVGYVFDLPVERYDAAVNRRTA